MDRPNPNATSKKKGQDQITETKPKQDDVSRSPSRISGHFRRKDSRLRKSKEIEKEIPRLMYPKVKILFFLILSGPGITGTQMLICTYTGRLAVKENHSTSIKFSMRYIKPKTKKFRINS